MSGTSQNSDKFRSHKPGNEPETDWTALKAFHSDLYHDLSDLNRQVRMISESLAACKKISRRRQLNSHHSKPLTNIPNSEKIARTTLNPQWSPQTPAQIILPPEERTQVLTAENDPTTIVSYMVENHSPLDFLEPFLPSNLRREGTVPLWTNAWSDNSAIEAEADVRKRASFEWTQETERMNSMKLLEVIQKELKNLMQIVPFASPIIVELSNILFHYKKCSRCSKKSHGFYPSVLARIQNLTVYASQRRNEGNQVRSNQLPTVRKDTDKTWLAAPKEKNSRKGDRSKLVQIGQLMKVDASAAADCKPGFQVQLLVKPEKGKKRFFESLKRQKVAHNFQSSIRSNNQVVVSLVDLHEADYNLNLNVLRTCSRPKIRWQKKGEIIPARAFAFALRFYYLVPEPETLQVSVFLFRELLSFLEVVRIETYPKQTQHHEEFVLVRDSKFVQIQVQKIAFSAVKPSENEIEPENCQDSEESIADLMREFLEEAQKEDMMHVQKVKDLEDEVKTLKDLMMEVHKNQIELSKILLEKGIYSLPIMKLTDPKVLEEETEAVKRASLLETPRQTSSTESLQIAVDELKKKCAIKNRMILALLKGLRSNVPNQWWEELVDCIFNESKPIEEFDTERVNEFIRQTSLYLIKGEKASTGKRALSPSPSSPGPLPIQNAASEESFSNRSKTSLECREEPHKSGNESNENFVEVIAKKREELVKQTERLSNLLEPRCTSSFIQNILYEDSKAGVAVVDLFVAVKRAKDKLNLLTKVNNETWMRMNALNREAGTMKTDYCNFVGNVNDFFDRMNDVAQTWMNGRGKQTKYLKEREKEDVQSVADLVGNLKFDEKQQFTTDQKTSSSSEEDAKTSGTTEERTRVHVLNKTPEDVIATLITSSLKSKNYDSCQKETEKTNLDAEHTEKLSDLNVQVICDVCEILSAVGVGNYEEEEEESSRQNLPLGEKGNISDEDVFEEALAEPLPSLHLELNSKLSVNCMGDLTDTGKRKNVSTLTTNRGPETSWIAKLTEEIKSKLKNLKPKYKKPVTDVEETGGSESAVGGTEFTISARTPVGVFDVTIRQYKQFGNLKEVNGRKSESSSPVFIAKLDNQNNSGEMYPSIKDSNRYWSEDSFQNADSNRSSFIESSPGEEDIEEFLEVYVQSQNGSSRKNGKESVSLEKGTMIKTTLKQGKPPVFEIEKYQPKYFVQEIWPKEAKAMMKSESTAKDTGFTGVRFEPSNDLVIYIQVEVDEENVSGSKNVYIECESSRENVSGLREKKEEFQLEKSPVENGEKDGSVRERAPTAPWDESEKEVRVVREAKKKSVTFLDESEVAEERKVAEIVAESEDEEGSEVVREVSAVVRFLREAESCLVCHMPRELCSIERFEIREGKEIEEVNLCLEVESAELQTAIDLIHEIENSVVGVKLSDAILILPALESELRKLLQGKMRKISESGTSTETSMQDFFSVVDFWPEDSEDSESRETDNSEERLINLYALLSNLENAVKANATSLEKIDLCDENSFRVYHLLQALTRSIGDLENGANMTNIAETLNIASQLDAAVREYDSIVRRSAVDWTNDDHDPDRKARDQMKNMRKKVFQTVEEQAIRTEGRIERDFDRIDRLERENEEALCFVEAYLKKTTRRSAELTLVQDELKVLSLTLDKLYKEAASQMEKEKAQKKREEEKLPEKESVRNTVSGLLLALNNLQIKARKKNEACRELLGGVLSDAPSKVAPLENKISRSSRSSFTTRTANDLFCLVKDFRRIGETSLYMAWSKPEGCLSGSVTGYEVFVNEKLNQKVRNPQRTQAVLYSIDLTGKVDVLLYGLVENGPKMLLASVTHYDT